MVFNKKMTYGFIGIIVLLIIAIAAFFLVGKKKEPYTPGTGGTQPNDLTLTTDNAGNLSTTYSVPIGTIVLWYRDPDSIPKGWGICDGSTYGGIKSPDLRNVFVLGAGGLNGNPNTQTILPNGLTQYGSGGGLNYASFTLTAANLPPHNHAIPVEGGTGPGNRPALESMNVDVNPGGIDDYTVSTNNNDYAGNQQPIVVSTVPPYLALYYIIKYM